jgi:hypothetical protein
MDSGEPNVFQTTATPKTGELGFVVRVMDSVMGTFTMPTPGSTTYAACKLPNKTRMHEANFKSCVFAFNEPGPGNYHSFYFLPPRTSEEALVTIESYYEIDPSTYWPPVLTALQPYLLENLHYTFKPTFKGPYSGAARVLVEEFFSHTPHTITLSTQMRPETFEGVLQITGAATAGGIPYYYNMGELELKSCLRGSYSFVLPSPTFTVGIVTYSDCTMVVPATNVSSWPDTVVTQDGQRKVAGGYVRRRVTASKPY